MTNPMTRYTARPLKFAAGFSAAIACAVVALSLADATPVSSREIRAATSAALARPPLTDVSGRRKRPLPRAAVAAPQPHPTWTGADPTKGPGIAWVREQQRSGRCIIDEGYGRWTACSNM
jgi:hypothetical protein